MMNTLNFMTGVGLGMMSQSIYTLLDNPDCKLEDLLDREGLLVEFKELKNPKLDLLFTQQFRLFALEKAAQFCLA